MEPLGGNQQSMTMKLKGQGLIILMAFATFVIEAEVPNESDARESLRALKPAKRNLPDFNGVFEPTSGETIVFLGGTNVVDEQFANYFEALATWVWADKELHFRNLAWQADTVYRQQRPLYFYDPINFDQRAGSVPDQRQRVETGSVFVRFGKMESLDGLVAIPAFIEAYNEFLDQLMKLTPRIVIQTPTPFFLAGPAAHLARKRNEVLDAYAHAIRTLASERDLIVVDLFRGIPADADLSDNGVHLNEMGHQLVAEFMIERLSNRRGSIVTDSKVLASLREQIAYKNSIWLQYYRPTNWAFLYGDRQWVPSSRDHTDSEKRWFPFEIESALRMIEQEENRIQNLVREGR